jgi:hypothetical protein
VRITAEQSGEVMVTVFITAGLIAKPAAKLNRETRDRANQPRTTRLEVPNLCLTEFFPQLAQNSGHSLRHD